MADHTVTQDRPHQRQEQDERNRKVDGSTRDVRTVGSQAPGPATVRVARRYRATPQRVFDAWLEPEVARRWLFATATRPMTRVEIDARAGGGFRFSNADGAGTAEHSGEYVAIEPYRRLIFMVWVQSRPPIRTRVTVEIAELGAGCRLTLVQEGVPRERVKQAAQRWLGILYGLGVTLDTSRKRSQPGTHASARESRSRKKCGARSGEIRPNQDE